MKKLVFQHDGGGGGWLCVAIWSRDHKSKDNHEKLFQSSDNLEQTVTCSSETSLQGLPIVLQCADINMWAHRQKWLKSQGKFHNKEESADATNIRIR